MYELEHVSSIASSVFWTSASVCQIDVLAHVLAHVPIRLEVLACGSTASGNMSRLNSTNSLRILRIETVQTHTVQNIP